MKKQSAGGNFFSGVPEIHHANRSRWVVRFAGWLFTHCGWKLIGEITAERKMVLVVGPHTSNWDFVIAITAMLALDIQLHWLGKHTLFRKPFTSLMKNLGGIPVNRSRAEGFAEQTAEHIRNADTLILAITPEGTRSKVARLKTGFSRIARETPCPILPVTFDYARKEIRLFPLFAATDDSEGDAASVRDIFATATAKHPAKF